MATNLTLNTQPLLWNSAYSDINYIFDFNGETITGVAEPSAGTIRVTISGTWDINPSVNQYCNIDSGIYSGTFRVTGSTSSTVDLKTDYTGTQTSGTIKSLRSPTFSLYKGFKPTEDFPTELPYTLVGNFNLLFNSNYQIEVNLKGLIQRIFEITEPDLTSDYDFSAFNAFRLEYDGEKTDIRYALNSSISTAELNDSYLANGAYLVNTELPIMWGCGVSFFTKFVNGFPTLQVFNSGTQVTAGFSNAFQSNQFNQGLDIN